MAIVKAAKEELYRVLLNESKNDTQSEVLPNPSYAGTGDTTYLSDLKGKISNTSDEKILKVDKYTDKEIVLISYKLTSDNTSMYGAILIYDRIGNLLLFIDQVLDGDTPVKLPLIYDAKLSEDGLIYGLSNGYFGDTYEQATHFFVLNNIIPLIGTFADIDIKNETFFSAFLNVERIIYDDKTGSKVKGGNAAFGMISDPNTKFGFNRDEKDPNIYGFVIWNPSNKKVNVIRFSTDVVNTEINDIEWLLNETLSLGEGDEFTDISVVDIQTGESLLKNGKTSFGSIALSTQQDAGQDIDVPFNLNYPTSQPISFSKPEENILRNFGLETQEFVIADKASYFTPVLKQLNRWFNQQTSNLDYSLTIEVMSLWKADANTNNQAVKILLDKTSVDSIIASTKADLKIKITGTIDRFNRIDTAVEYEVELDTKTISLNSVNFLADPNNIPFDDNGRINQNVAAVQFEYIVLTVPNKFARVEYKMSASISEVLNVNGTTPQAVIQKNESSQILIEKVDDKIVYAKVQSENNSYEGTAPVFESSQKLFFPLKKKETKQYSIFEFNGKVGDQLSTRPFRDIATQDNDEPQNIFYRPSLIDPVNIISVNKNGDELKNTLISIATYTFKPDSGGNGFTKVHTLTTPIADQKFPIQINYNYKDITDPVNPVQESSEITFKTKDDIITNGDFIFRIDGQNIEIKETNVFTSIMDGETGEIFEVENPWDFVSGVLTVYNVLKGDRILISYETYIGIPKEITVSPSTGGEDIFLTSVFDNNELGTISKAIVGAGDDSFNGNDPTTIFGFNLYKDKKSIDYNKIAEAFKSLNFKVSHVVASRENNILFIKAFNDDYSKFVTWKQIYPDSFDPYKYTPYFETRNYFAIDGVTINKDGDRAKTVFDNKFYDVPSSGNTLIATTNVKSSDGNDQDNNLQTIVGRTNLPLFEFAKSLIKTSQESVTLNYNITSEIKDMLDKDVVNENASRRLTRLFSEPNSDIFEELALDVFRVTYEDTQTVTTEATQYMTLDIDNDLIKVGLTLYNKDVGQASDNKPILLELLNKGGDIVGTVDLTKNVCLGAFTNISFNIIISTSEASYLKYGENFYGEVPWAPLRTKGDK